MIIVKVSSGLGNQIFQYAMGLTLSETRNTKCLIDIAHYNKNNNRNFRLKYFKVKLNYIPTWKIRFYKSDFAKLIDKVFLTEYYHPYIIDPIWEKVNFYEGKNLILRGYWPFNEYFDSSINRIKKEIVVDPQFSTYDHQKLLLEVGQKESISLHIRRGDYKNNAEAFNLFGLLSKEYYINAINLIIKRLKNPLFFIFSDDINWVKDNMDLPKCSVYVSEIIGGVDYLEFDLMCACKHNIIANSTFSWWAAFLNDYKNRIVIQPKRWYKSDHAQKVYESKEILFIKDAIRI